MTRGCAGWQHHNACMRMGQRGDNSRRVACMGVDGVAAQKKCGMNRGCEWWLHENVRLRMGQMGAAG